MSNGYGIDIYGIDTYGYSQSADYSVAPFIASQTDYGKVTLTWASPNVTSWKALHLVRSTYGYPSTASDGVFVQEITPGNIARSFDDVGLTAGVIYYYTMFLTVESPAWAVGTTYALNAQVLYNGVYWCSSTNGNVGHTPAAGSSFWNPTNYIPIWLPAGHAATLALGNQGYADLLYDRAPQPYKINTSDTFGNSQVDNPALQNYLSLFGFGLDMLKASYDSYLQLNDADTVSATSLDILGQQLGINTNYLSTPQQRRQRIKNASFNYRIKGQTQSIHNLIAELTGWDSDITYGPNMFNSPDQTTFAHPVYDSWDSNVTYFVNNLVQFNGFNYRCILQAVGVAKQPTGANSSNTWWSVQNQVLDTTINSNPRTGQYSTWSAINGVANGSITGIMTSMPSSGGGSVRTLNALAASQTNANLSGTYFLSSIAPYTTPNYSAAANYVINNYVLGADGYYYKAHKPSGPATSYGAITPGTNQTFWKPLYYKPGDVPNTIKDGIPITHVPAWDAGKMYMLGDKVQYKGIIYTVAVPSTNSAPSGYYYSNANWIFISPAQKTVVNSSDWGRGDVTDSQTTSIYSVPFYYDSDGNQISNTAPDYSNYIIGVQGAYARFVIDYANLNNTSEPSMESDLALPQWAAVGPTAAWRSQYGMAYVDQPTAGTTPFVYLLTNAADNTGGRFAATFITPYQDPIHRSQALVFCYKDTSNFYYATRQSLRQVLAGVDTIISSWDYIDGEFRMVIDADADIHVYRYARTGDGALLLIGQSIGHGPVGNANAGVKFGFLQKYSASGDL